MQARHNPVLGVLWMTGAAISFSASIVLVRHLSATFSTFEILLFRLIFGTVVMLPWLIRVGLAGMRTENIWFYTWRAVLTFAASFASYYAVRLITIADAVALQFTLPIFTAIVAAIALRERVYRHRWIGILCGFAGAMIIVRPGFAEVNLGGLFAVGAAVLFAGVDVMTRFLTGKDSINQVLLYSFILQFPLAILPAALDWVTPGLADLPWIAAFVLVAFGAQICMTKSFAVAEASLVSPVLYLRLPVVALLGYVFFVELPSGWTWVGAAILFASTYYSTARDTAMSRERTTA